MSEKPIANLVDEITSMIGKLFLAAILSCFIAGMFAPMFLPWYYKKCNKSGSSPEEITTAKVIGTVVAFGVSIVSWIVWAFMYRGSFGHFPGQ